MEYRAELEAAEAGQDGWVMGGGGLAGQFAAAGMLDEVFVSIAPVLLGSGKPPFTGAVQLEMRECARNRDFVGAQYDVVR